MTFLLSLLGFGKTALGWLAEAGRALVRWVFADLRHVVIVALVVVALVFWWGRGEWRDIAEAETVRADEATALVGALREQYRQFAFRVMAAQEQADREAAANVARVEAEFAAINERVTDDYEARLGDTDAALDGLRQRLAAARLAPAGGSGADATAVPGPLTARCQAFGAADCDALLATLPDTLAHAERNTAQLIGLQAYVNAMLAVDYSGAPASEAGAAD